jgi:glycosyltransferase involved in cell wall biosynthesis
MRVLVVADNYPSATNPIGGTFVKSQVEALRRLGVQTDVFHVLNTYYWPLSRLRGQTVRPEVWETNAAGHQYITSVCRILPRVLTGPDWVFGLFSGAVNRRLEEVVEKLRPDLLHFHAGRTLGYAYDVLAKHPELATVITSHGACTRESRRRPNYCRLMQRTFRRADRVILVSEKLRRDALELGFAGDNLRVIGNGIAESQLREKSEHWSPESGRPLRIIGVGNLWALKGHDDSIRAVGLLRERGRQATLDIVGAGAEAGRLAALVNSLGLGGQVKLHGGLPRETTVQMIGESDLMCLPSWNEGFGIVYLEALAQSVPVIACRGQGIEPLVVESESGFLVDPHSPEQIAARIEELMVRPGLATELGERGRRYVGEHWTEERIGRQIIGIYEEALAAARGRQNKSR